jgi:small-conductance mechanosensitive channel
MRGADGQLHVIPNGEVRIVSNLTKEWSRAIVDVGVAYEEDLDRVFAPHLLEAPQVLGPMSLGDWAITMRVMVKTRPGKQWEVARELRKRILVACEREGIVLPYPRQETWTRSLNPAETQASVRAKS